MAYKSVENSSLTSLANKIREKAKTSNQLSVPDGMISAINSIVNASDGGLFKIAYGRFDSSSSSRKTLSVTGLDFRPVGAAFVATYINAYNTDLSSIVSDKLTANSYGMLDGLTSYYYPVVDNYITLGNDFVTVTEPVAKNGTKDVNATLKGKYAYVIWGK